MKVLVVYDSRFGHTERLARTIAEALGTEASTTVVAANATTAQELVGLDLLVVGGPTQAHGLSPILKTFLDTLLPSAVRGVPTVTFDTRLHGPRFLTGSAAIAIARQLEKKGVRLVAPPESFAVSGSEGPLAEGELDRAVRWVRAVQAAASRSTQERAGVTP